MIDSFWTPGVDDPDDAMNREIGVGNLSPENWFTWFYDDETRDPRRLLEHQRRSGDA